MKLLKKSCGGCDSKGKRLACLTAELLHINTMTAAVCLKCGSMKLGALTPCLKCGYMPEDFEDQARAMILSDHFLDAHSLSSLGERIAKGDPPPHCSAACSLCISNRFVRSRSLARVTSMMAEARMG